jgi:hypothetical protein
MEEEFGLKLIASVKKKKQKVGNCTIANGKEMLYNAAFLLRLDQLLQDKENLSTALQIAHAHAHHVQKEQMLLQKVHQLILWRIFARNIPANQPKILRKHFEILQMISTKFVNNPYKLEKYQKLGALPGSLIPETLHSLHATMQEIISENPCDIEFCTGPIPFHTGSRIKNGPNCGFGIYKSRDSENNIKFYLALKNSEGKYSSYTINLNPIPKEGKYSIQLEEGKSASFTTLGELSKMMRSIGNEMCFAL